MPISYVTWAKPTDLSSVASSTVNLTSRSVGELIIVWHDRYSQVDLSQTPSGWTEAADYTFGANARLWVFWKVLTSSDLTTHTWTWSTTNAKTKTCYAVFSGASRAEASAGTWTDVNTGTGITHNSYTTDFSFIVCRAGVYSSNSTRSATPPTSPTFTEPSGADDWLTNSDFMWEMSYYSSHTGGSIQPTGSTISSTQTNRFSSIIALDETIRPDIADSVSVADGIPGIYTESVFTRDQATVYVYTPTGGGPQVTASDQVNVSDAAAIKLSEVRINASDSVVVSDSAPTVTVQPASSTIEIQASDQVNVSDQVFVSNLHKLYITFAFADGLSNQINFYNSCAEYTPHYPATTNLITDNIDSGALTSAQVTTMYNGGWEIGSHNKDAECTSPYTAELQAAYNFIVNSGWGECRAFDAPNALNNSALATEVKKFHHYNLCHFWDFNQTPLDYEYGIDCPAYVVADYSTAQELMDAVDTALAECDTAKTWLILHWHGFSGDETVFDTFLGNLDNRIKNQGLVAEVVTLTNGYKIFKPDYTELITKSDTVSVQDSTPSVYLEAGVSSVTAQASDQVNVSDAAQIKLSEVRITASDSVTAADVAQVKLGAVQIMASDQVTTSDVGQIKLSEVRITASDSVTTTDVGQIKLSEVRISASDQVTAQDSTPDVILGALPPVPVQASDQVNVTDVAQIKLSEVRIATSDQINVSDSAPSVQLHPLKIVSADQVNVSDVGQAIVEGAAIAQASDQVNVSDVAQIKLSEVRITASDQVTVQDEPIVILGAVRVTASDSVTASDAGQLRLSEVRIEASDQVTTNDVAIIFAAGPAIAAASDQVNVSDEANIRVGTVKITTSDQVIAQDSTPDIQIPEAGKVYIGASDVVTAHDIANIRVPYILIFTEDSVIVADVPDVKPVLKIFASDTVVASDIAQAITANLLIQASDRIVVTDSGDIYCYVPGTRLQDIMTVLIVADLIRVEVVDTRHPLDITSDRVRVLVEEE